jgi:hypothetical protein
MPDNDYVPGDMAVATEDDFNEPYLPERYKKRVREKQQRRQTRKILLAGAVVAIISVSIWLLAGFTMSGPHEMPPQTVPATASIPATEDVSSVIPETSASAVPAQASISATSPATATNTALAGEYSGNPTIPPTVPEGMLSLDEATVAFREYYPEANYAISSVNFSSGISRSLFGFTIRPKGSITRSTEPVIFIDAATGIPWAADQETAAFPQEKVKGVVTSLFSETGQGTVKTWYHDDPVRGGLWMFNSASGNLTLITGSLDASTGELISFTRSIPQSGRPQVPVITAQKAQSIANNYLRDQTGGTFTFNLTSAGYDTWGTPSVPVAGRYFFTWQRMYLDYPVDTDGVTAAVDAVNGDMIAFDRQLTTPDFAFSQIPEQTVVQRDATFAIMKAAKEIYPGSVESIRILSAEIRWNNAHTPDTSQRPGTVPLGWKIVFDDTEIRAEPSLHEAVAWVDIQSGDVTSMDYRH